MDLVDIYRQTENYSLTDGGVLEDTAITNIKHYASNKH